MKKLISLLLAISFLPVAAYAWQSHQHNHGNSGQSRHQRHSHDTGAGGSSGSGNNGGQPPVVTPPPPPPITGNSIALENVWLTGYADGDNTPPGSPVTDLDGHHGVAGGNCTFDNPTTLAVGHVITNGNDVGDFAYGTKFYVPKLQCYFQAADTCGDGNTPQNGPCHKPEQGSLQLDLYVGPNGTDSCESNMTAIYSVIENPLAGLPVKIGNICN